MAAETKQEPHEPEPKGKGDIPFTEQTGYRHKWSLESLCNRGQKLAAHKDQNQ